MLKYRYNYKIPFRQKLNSLGWEFEFQHYVDNIIQECINNLDDNLKNAGCENFEKKNLIIKEDGSISGDEVVTPPVDIKYFNYIKEFYKSIHDCLPDYDYDKPECGIHFHQPITKISKQQLIMMYLAINLNRNYVRHLSGKRKFSTYSDFHMTSIKAGDIFRRIGRLYYDPDFYIDQEFNLETNKYKALNICKKTLEHRIFIADRNRFNQIEEYFDKFIFGLDKPKKIFNVSKTYPGMSVPKELKQAIINTINKIPNKNLTIKSINEGYDVMREFTSRYIDELMYENII